MNHLISILRKGDRLAIAAAIVCVVLGTSVIVTWYARYIEVIQLHPSFALMQYNTALGFLASGATLLAYLYRWRLAFLIGVTLVAGLGLLTLFEHVFGLDVGIDQLFFRPYLVVAASQQGRMGSNTAFCFVLTAAALALFNNPFCAVHPKRRRVCVFVLTGSIFVLAVSVLLSYAVSALSHFRLGTFSDMSVATATGFVALALGLLGAAQRKVGDMLSLAERKTGLAALVLLISLAVTGVGWYASVSYVSRASHEEFDLTIGRITDAIQERMRHQEQILFGAKGLFDAMGKVTREQWRTYVEVQRIDERYSGIQGVGFSRRISTANLPAFVRSVHADGYPYFKIRPNYPRAEYHAIVYLEPFDWRNRRAFGYDMYSEPTRREAMQRARDTGEPAVSGPVTLVQETDEDIQSGFLMYLPVYVDGGVPRDVATRRRTLVGFVYSPFRVADLMAGIFDAARLRVYFRIFDGNVPRPASLLYTSGFAWASGITSERAAYTGMRRIEFGGRVWTLTFTGGPTFTASSSRYQPLAVLTAGTLISFLLFGVTWSLATTRSRALTLADEMTLELRESQERFQAVSDTALDAIVSADSDGRIIYVNKTAERIFEFRAAELIGRPLTVLMPERFHEAHRQGVASLRRYPRSAHDGEGGRGRRSARQRRRISAGAVSRALGGER